MVRAALDNPAYFINRETSWLEFNRRVLQEAEDESNPLLERVKFLAITANNLDEFFEVRVAGLVQQIEDGFTQGGPDGLTLSEERGLIAKSAKKFVDEQYRCWNNELLPELMESGIRVLGMEDLDPEARAFAEEYCEKELDPLLTPVTVDPAHPFPRVINKALCMAFLLRRRRRSSMTYMGVVTVPRSLPRLIRLPSEGTTDYIFLADLVAHHAARMYQGYEIISAAAFRVTRNSNLYLQEEESRNILESVRAELHNRRKGDAVRLEIEANANQEIIDRLRTNFELDPWQVQSVDGPVNLSRLFTIYEQTDRPDLKYRPFTPRELRLTGKAKDFFEELRQHDVMLHHPYDSYDAIVSFVASAATDPNVLAIKQTLYRTGDHSPIVQALISAAEKKEVTAVVELKARFDEASNIRWARDMEDAGVQVFHGLVGLKTHCKLCLLVRRDPDGITRRYCHIGTGNYNPSTAKIYTDFSLFTGDPQITSAVHNVFSFLTAYAEHADYDPLLVAPLHMAEQCVALIDRETAHARAGRPARIIAKMNALLDKNMVVALYRAAQSGVEIDLIVRGICSLRPGIRGVSSRIHVRSIVGRYLEHSRVFDFANGGEGETWIGSADWMPRNLHDRVEVLVPVRDEFIRERIRYEILDALLQDNRKARLLQPDGTYLHTRRVRRGQVRQKADGFNAQEFFMGLAEGKLSPDAIPTPQARRTRDRIGKEI